jgi:phospholipase C
MISVSVRSALNLEGRSASLRQIVNLHNVPIPRWFYPLSLRAFVGALPPGQILRKVIPLDLLQRKFDEFVNQREPPLVELRLHGTEYGSSRLKAYQLTARGDAYEPEPFWDEDMGHLEVDLPGPNPDFHFNDLKSDLLAVRVIPAPWAPVIESFLRFETGGEEIKVNNFGNINFERLGLTLRMELTRGGNRIDLFGWLDEIDAVVERAESTNQVNQVFVRTRFRGRTYEASGGDLQSAKRALRKEMVKPFVIPDAKVDVNNLPDTLVDVLTPGSIDGKVESTIRSTVLEALTKPSTPEKEAPRDRLKRKITGWLLGGDFHVVSVASDSERATVEYVLPPRQLEPFPENPQPPLDPGLLANIDHIVVLMMENRSFDHMLGYLSKHGGRTDIDGLHGGEKNPYKGLDYFSGPLPGTVFSPGPCHEHECVVNQVNGGRMDGFVADYAPRADEDAVDPGQVMGYYTASQVPFYDDLADSTSGFLICQRWFAAHPGPTFPNRFYTLTGRLNRDPDGRWEFNNPVGGEFMPVLGTKTIFDHLTAQGVSWRYYEHGYCFLRLFERYTFDTVNIVDAGSYAENFAASARAGTLPSVTFIDPDFVNVPPGTDDQPPANIADGQRLIGTVVEALVNGPRWNKTLLIVTYDEHGGFFDHVPPPPAPPVSAIDRYGVRVPAFVVSPWVKPGTTDVVFDHTSIPKTIIRRFLNIRPPDLGERVAAANDLSRVLESTPRSDRPVIPVPPSQPLDPSSARLAEMTTEGPGDFRALLRSMRTRYPVRR